MSTNLLAQRQSAGREPERGMALLITLVLVVLSSFVILGLLSNMRVEREIARSYSEDVRVRWAAESGLAEALACLSSATAPASANEILATAPGVVYRLSSSGISTQTLCNLSNTTDRLVDQGLDANNLNINGWLCGSNALYPMPAQTDLPDYTVLTNADLYSITNHMFVAPGWTALGTNFQAAGLTGSFTNPVILRYSYWIDAESCKVNLQSARTRLTADTYASGATNIDVRALEGVFFSSTNQTLLADFFSHPRRPFVSLEQMRLPNGSWPGQRGPDFELNKFLTTIYGSTNQLDVFERDRINLHDLTATNTPAYAQAMVRLQETRYADVVYPAIITTAGRRSLGAKYGSFGQQQILANLIDYQRPHADLPTLSEYADSANPLQNHYMIPARFAGLKKGPLIEQILIYTATNQVSATNLEVSVFVNAKFVNGFDVARGNGYNLRVMAEQIQIQYEDPPGAPATTVLMPITAEAPPQTISSDMAPGEYRPLNAVIQAGTPEFKTNLVGTAGNLPVVTRINVKLRRIRLLRSNDPADIVDWMTKADFDHVFPAGIDFPQASATLTNDIVAWTNLVANFTTPASPHFRPTALGKHDPRVRTFPGWSGAAGDFANGSAQNFQINWRAYNFSQINPSGPDDCSTNFSSRLSPDTYALLADVRQPDHAYLQQTIREAPMTSLGELGEIHTGYPWRCLRLASVYPFTTNASFALDATATNVTAISSQLADHPLQEPWLGAGDPNGSTNTSLDRRTIELHAAPDWLLLDIFQAGTQTMAGQINLNQQFSAPAGGLSPRYNALEALLMHSVTGLTREATALSVQVLDGGSATNLFPVLEWLAENIASRRCLNTSPYATLPVFGSPGQVCEIVGIHLRPTAAGSTTNDRFQRGAILRRIANLITTRSDVFSIHVVAEAVEDLDRDGRFDWIYQQKYRYLPPTNPYAASIPAGWWQSNVVDTVMTNYQLASGDGDADLTMDRLIGRIRLQAVVERYWDPADTLRAHPKYRVLYTRYFAN